MDKKELELVIEVGYELAKKERPDLDENEDNWDEQDKELMKKYVYIVRDCLTILGNKGYGLAEKEPSWEEFLKDPSNKAIAYLYQEINKMVEKEIS